MESKSHEPVPIVDLIQKVSGSEVEGMDDRVSLSSDDSMIIHDEKPKKGSDADDVVISSFVRRTSSFSCMSLLHVPVRSGRDVFS